MQIFEKSSQERLELKKAQSIWRDSEKARNPKITKRGRKYETVINTYPEYVEKINK